MRYGKTRKEKGIDWNDQRESDKIGRKVFAWWPVFLPDGRTAWLEHVWARLDIDTWMSPRWVYEPLPEYLQR